MENIEDLEKNQGGRPRKSVTDKLERVVVFIPALLVSKWPPIKIRELVIDAENDSLMVGPVASKSDEKKIPSSGSKSETVSRLAALLNLKTADNIGKDDNIAMVHDGPFGAGVKTNKPVAVYLNPDLQRRYDRFARILGNNPTNDGLKHIDRLLSELEDLMEM